MDFDRNNASNGNSISHAEGSADFIIEEPGYYYVSFHGTLSPASGVDFPLALSLVLQQQGASVPGTSVYHTFQTSTDTSNVAFTQIIEATTAPITLNMVGSGGNFIYANISMVIHRMSGL